MATYKGTKRSDKLKADGYFGEIVRMYGLAGDDELAGGFSTNNYIHGGAGNDSISGGAFDNYFFGDGGNDILDLFFGPGQGMTAELRGGDGNDELVSHSDADDNEVLLDGGRGIDVLRGGEGRDIYVVSTRNDRIVETYVPHFDNEVNPRDEVRASVSWILAKKLEDLTLLGGRDLDGTGNGASNVIAGNKGNNRLEGLGGRDRISGGDGDDTLLGGDGDDRLQGDQGTDRLFGGRDGDVFAFRSMDSSPAGAERDVVTDFSLRDDRIDVSALDASVTLRGNQRFTFIDSDPFSNVAGELRFSGHILRGDSDGDGRADIEVRVLGIAMLDDRDLIL